MADSIRETVLQALKTALEGITIANGYETDMGKTVERGLRVPLEEDELPAIVIVEGEEDVASEPFAKNTCYLQVEIHGYVTFTDSDEGNWSAIGNKQIADIVKLIGLNQNLGGLAIDMQPAKRMNYEPESETVIKAVQVDFIIQYRTGYLDPYNQ